MANFTPMTGRTAAPSAVALILLLTMVGCAGRGGGSDVRAGTPQEAFAIYRTALLEADGATAAGIVTKRTLRYYDDVRRAALYSTRAELGKISVQKKMVALLFRLRFSGDALKSMSSRDIFALAVNNGMIGTEGARRIRLTDYQVTGRIAKAHIAGAKGAARKFTFDFMTENGGWKVDLISLLHLSEAIMWVSLDRSGAEDADAYIISTLEKIVRRRVGPDVWTPLIAQ